MSQLITQETPYKGLCNKLPGSKDILALTGLRKAVTIIFKWKFLVFHVQSTSLHLACASLGLRAACRHEGTESASRPILVQYRHGRHAGTTLCLFTFDIADASRPLVRLRNCYSAQSNRWKSS